MHSSGSLKFLFVKFWTWNLVKFQFSIPSHPRWIPFTPPPRSLRPSFDSHATGPSVHVFHKGLFSLLVTTVYTVCPVPSTPDSELVT